MAEEWARVWDFKQTDFSALALHTERHTQVLKLVNNLEARALRVRFSNVDGLAPLSFSSVTAVAYGALANNPVRGSLSISRPAASHPALSPGEVANVQAAVRVWLSKQRPGPRSSGDMADIIEVMLATGARIGEVLALRWRDINLDARSIEINATVKSESGKGTYRKAIPRTRTVELTQCATLLLSRRRRMMHVNLLDSVFPTRNATWQQVNNVERRWRQIRREAGLDWITPEHFRRGDAAGNLE